MKYLFIAICLAIVTPSEGQGRVDAKSLSEKLAARFTNDNSTHNQTYSFVETDPIGYDLLTANLSFSDKNQIQKIGFSPIRFSKKYYFLLSNLRTNFTHSGGALTAGLSIGDDNSAFESGRVQRIFHDIYSPANTPDARLPIARARRADETLKQYMEYYNTSPEMKEFQNKLLNDFDSIRLKHVVKYSAGYNIQFFPVLQSSSVEGNFDSLNYHGIKSNNVFVKGSYSFSNGLINVNASYNYFKKRKSADSTQEKRKYEGYTIGVSIRAIPLIRKENLVKKDFYKNSLFVPGIYLGVNWDQTEYRGAEAIFAEEKLRSKSVITISVDFAISPASQFRLAFPIQKTKEFDLPAKSTHTVAVLQYSFKFINLTE